MAKLEDTAADEIMIRVLRNKLGAGLEDLDEVVAEYVGHVKKKIEEGNYSQDNFMKVVAKIIEKLKTRLGSTADSRAYSECLKIKSEFEEGAKKQEPFEKSREGYRHGMGGSGRNGEIVCRMHNPYERSRKKL